MFLYEISDNKEAKIWADSTENLTASFLTVVESCLSRRVIDFKIDTSRGFGIIPEIFQPLRSLQKLVSRRSKTVVLQVHPDEDPELLSQLSLCGLAIEVAQNDRLSVEFVLSSQNFLGQIDDESQFVKALAALEVDQERLVKVEQRLKKELQLFQARFSGFRIDPQWPKEAEFFRPTHERETNRVKELSEKKLAHISELDQLLKEFARYELQAQLRAEELRDQMRAKIESSQVELANWEQQIEDLRAQLLQKSRT